MVLLIALLLAGAYVALSGHHYPAGEGPFDRLPAGVLRANASAPDKVVASSGVSYQTYTWPPDSSGRQFHVAESTHDPAWVAYWYDRGSSVRTLYLSRVPAATGTAQATAELAQLRKDFGV